jgi:hypothetical protein
VQVVPLIDKLVAEAVRKVGTKRWLQSLDNLLAIVKAIDSRILNGDQHVRDAVVVKQIGRFGLALFCATGVMNFTTSMEMFDRDFPGQYVAGSCCATTG